MRPNHAGMPSGALANAPYPKHVNRSGIDEKGRARCVGGAAGRGRAADLATVAGSSSSPASRTTWPCRRLGQQGRQLLQQQGALQQADQIGTVRLAAPTREGMSRTHATQREELLALLPISARRYLIIPMIIQTTQPATSKANRTDDATRVS